MKRPFSKIHSTGNGLFFVAPLLTLVGALSLSVDLALAGDGPTEALELRYHAERAIADERNTGNKDLANAMQRALPDLLQEYLVTRDATVALDAVDSAFVQEQFRIASALEEPGVALALDVFAGPGTGYENELRSRLARLADFQSDQAWTVSEAALSAHEQMMERQLERLEHDLANTGLAFTRFDAKFDAKIDSRLDSGTDDLTEGPKPTEVRIEAILVKTETKVETVVEKTESKVDQVVQVAEQKVEATPQKAESIVEKAEQKIDKIVEKAETKIDNIVQSAENKLDNLTSSTTTSDSSTSTTTTSDSGKKSKK